MAEHSGSRRESLFTGRVCSYPQWSEKSHNRRKQKGISAGFIILSTMPHHKMNGSVRNNEILRLVWNFQIMMTLNDQKKSFLFAILNMTESLREEKQYMGCETWQIIWHWKIDIKFLNTLEQRSHTTLSRRINRTVKDQRIDKTETHFAVEFETKEIICRNSPIFRLSFKYGDPGTDSKFRLSEERDEPGIKIKILYRSFQSRKNGFADREES